ncbi:MAG: hypothetical protein R6X02_20135 [Enhygromyxa sp.]
MEAPAVRYPALGRLLAHRHFVWVVVGLAFLVGLASLDNGLLADDHMHYRFLLAHRAGKSEAPWWDLFVLVEHNPQRTIGMRTSGRYPWWVDPELHIAFFRPLAAATHHLDHRLWPVSGVLMHAHSLAWHAAACAMAWALARRLVSDPRVAGLAAIIYTLSFSHVLAWSWLAHRNALVSTFFALASLLAHLRWRAEGKRGSAVAAPLLLGAALLSAEGAVVTLAFLLAYELAVSKDRARARLLALVPGLLIVFAWRMLYDQLGYGAFGSGGYIDPVGEPLAFLRAFPARYAALLALSVSAPFIPDLPPLLWIVSVASVGLVLLAFLFSPASRRGAARFGAVATALACVPLAASVPVDRLLILASFGVALVCAELLDAWLLHRRSLTHVLAAAWVGLLHIAVPGVVGVYVSSHLEQVFRLHSLAYGPTLPNEGLNKKGLVVLHTPHYPAADNLGANRALRGLASPNFLWILHAGPRPPEIVCVDEQTVELREPSAGWPVDGFSAQFRNIASKPFEVGDTVRTVDYVATVVDVDAGRATAVRFAFRARLDHASFVWATWGGDEFVPSSPREWCDRLGG